MTFWAASFCSYWCFRSCFCRRRSTGSTEVKAKGLRIPYTSPATPLGSSYWSFLIISFFPNVACRLCNSGKADYFAETAQASARPWWEARKDLLDGNVTITPTKRFCVLMRDSSTCRSCGMTALTSELRVVLRVPTYEGGQAVYDNLLTLCSACSQNH